MIEHIETPNEEKLFDVIIVFKIKTLGLVVGMLLGLTIFVATNWLIIKGGRIDFMGREVIGPHLQLLSQFFIGYKVSFAGSIIGFAYGLALGTLSGSLLAWIYNLIVKFRNRRLSKSP
jgi:hypothetical protein